MIMSDADARARESAQLDDERARLRALDATRSFIVQAPAGSGKTTVLTQRYLKLLASVDEPEQVLAITFTRKAAGEMRERVQQALAAAIEVRSPADALTLELAAAARMQATTRGWGLDESAARLRIQTIDAFNGYLANAMPITSRNGFGHAIADEPGDLYAAAARESLRLAEEDAELRPAFERILRRVDDQWMHLERLIAEMLPRRSEWLPSLPQLSGEELVPRIEHSLAEIVADELAQCAARLPADFLLQASQLARFAAQHVDAEREPDIANWRDGARPLVADVRDLARWRGIATLALTADNTARQKLTKNEGFPADDARGKMLKDDWIQRLLTIDPEHLVALATIRMLPAPTIPERERGALDALARLLLLAAQELTRLFDVYGECDHSQIAGAARQALTESSSPTPLAERLGTRLSHILVDEFQDTSREQYDLLNTLTREWSPGDGNTLFLVGDPMQSIYGFRNAEVGRFATVRAAGLPSVALEPLELRRNFRSAPALVDWCNRAFARAFPPADDVRRSAVRHLASVAARTNLEGAPCIHRVAGQNRASDESEAVGDMIAQLARERPGESVAVLASTRPHLRAVRAALAARNVPFIGINLEPLADVPVVRDLEALARALDSPLDRVAWLAVLRAPCVGLTLPDLTRICAAAGDGPIATVLTDAIPGLSPDGNTRLMRVRPILLAGWSGREREARAHLVERVWLALGGASACTQAAELTHARRFLAALDDEDRKRLRGRPPDLARLMNRLYAEDPARPGAVSLMTIHGSKGLEFDHVFVVGVGRATRADESRLLNWLEIPRERGGDHLIMAPIRMRGDDEGTDDEAINEYLRLLHKERVRAERTRQAYVALTRAKRSLHLFVHPNARDAGGVRSYFPRAGTLLENLWCALEEDIHDCAIVGDDAATETVEPVTSQLRRRLPAAFAPAVPPPDVIARGELFPLAGEDEGIEFSWVRQTARRIGTVVHEALERFGSTGLPDVTELQRLVPRLESRLTALGVEPDAARTGATRALTALRATLEDRQGRWLFDATHRDAQSELALTGLRGGHIVNAVIDRTFVDARGTRWIVDFKTSPHEGGNREAFLDEEAKRYAAQLQRYAHLARALGPEPVRAGLYFPLLCAWREVDVSQ
jgi:ATP-dependent helicase/nuclease subunit A